MTQLNAWLRNRLGYKGSIIYKWEGKIGNFDVCVWSDPPADRIRIHAAICDATDLLHKEILEANFHSTQDVHYAIYKGKVYAVFTHWLSELTEREIDKAFYQILQLAQNTLQGDYYSGDMVLAPAYRESLKEKLTKDKVKVMWRKCLAETDPAKKGRTFEDFVRTFLSLEPGFRLTRPNFRTINEEIDILIKNKIISLHWLNYRSPFIMVECKNRESKVEAKEIREFAEKIRSHINLCTLGFYFSVSRFEKGCEHELVGLRNTQVKLALIDGDMINKFFKEDRDLKEFLEDSITKSMR